ncbi:hypothetical protein Barb6XT_01479 [Bacteroidales bacterium Barb6XT]|nr:hypothetical protein Barb6XT_01479 [Bacteroidales bacterium Barb6XT]
MKKQALRLHLEGLGFRSIEKLSDVSNVSVLNWIRRFGKETQVLHLESKKTERAEVNGMHAYADSKKLSTDLDCR